MSERRNMKVYAIVLVTLAGFGLVLTFVGMVANVR
jgi:hypothetical protein